MNKKLNKRPPLLKVEAPGEWPPPNMRPLEEGKGRTGCLKGPPTTPRPAPPRGMGIPFRVTARGEPVLADARIKELEAELSGKTGELDELGANLEKLEIENQRLEGQWCYHANGKPFVPCVYQDENERLVAEVERLKAERVEARQALNKVDRALSR